MIVSQASQNSHDTSVPVDESFSDLKTGHGNTRLTDSAAYQQAVRTSEKSVLQAFPDWIRIKLLFLDEDRVGEFLTELGERTNDLWQAQTDVPLTVVRGVSRYVNSAYSVHGGRFGWQPVLDINEDEACYQVEGLLELPGQVLAELSVVQIWRLCNWFYRQYGAVATRFDLKLRDFLKEVQPAVINQARLSGLISNIRNNTGRWIDSGRRAIDERQTAEIGSRESDVFGRCYHAEHKHGVDAVDYEVEFKGEQSKNLFDAFVCAPHRFESKSKGTNSWEFQEELAKWIGGHVVGAFQFYAHRRDKEHRTWAEVPLVDWYVRLKERVGWSSRLRIVKRKSTIQETVDWVLRQVIVSLYVICEYMGGWEKFTQWMKRQFRKVPPRLSGYHKLLLQQISLEKQEGVLAQCG